MVVRSFIPRSYGYETSSDSDASSSDDETEILGKETKKSSIGISKTVTATGGLSTI